MKIQLSPLTLLFFAIYLLSVHDLTLLSTLSAIVVHELTHLIVLLLCNGRATRLSITPLGLSIERQGLLSHWNEALLSLSAPFLNLILAGLFGLGGLSSYAIYANLSFGVFNLLPIYPLDGSKALYSILGSLLSPARTTQICRLISWIFLFLWWLFAVAIAVFPDGNLSFLFLSAALFFSNASANEFYK